LLIFLSFLGGNYHAVFYEKAVRCQHEMQVNEAIIDVEIGMAELDGTYIKGFMPILGCPNCNQETMEYVEI
jgi:hypothetical protein